MSRAMSALALAAALTIPFAAPALAQRGHDRGGYYEHGGGRGRGDAWVGGAMLGLGVGALVGGAIAAAPPPAYYPPPVYYAPPPPVYYAPPPPAYYAPPVVYYGR